MSCRRGCSRDVGGQPSVAVLVHRWRSQPRLARLSRGRLQLGIEWGDATGEYGQREGARLIRSEMEVGRPSEAPTRYRAVWLQPGLPDVWEASVGANPRGNPSPTRRRSRESHDAFVRRGEGLFILTEEGERISVHRSGFLPGEAPGGRCPRRAVRLTATVQNGKRVAIDVSMAPEVAHGWARRRSSNTRSVWP